MTENTDPIWNVFLWIVLGTLALYVAGDRLVALLKWIDRWAGREVERAIQEALNDDSWDAWVDEAIALAAPTAADIAAEKLRAELNSPAAVAIWLGGAR